MKKQLLVGTISMAMLLTTGVASAATCDTYTGNTQQTLGVFENKYGIDLNQWLQDSVKNGFNWHGIVIQWPGKDQAGTGNTGNTGTPKPTEPSKPTQPSKPDTGNNGSGNNGSANNGSSNNGSGTTDNGSVSEFAKQVADLVNQERAKAGLSPLTLDTELSNVALAKAKDMYTNNYFDHTSPTYGSPFQMMEKYGISYRSAGENIAKGQRTPQEVMNAWMNSEGHRKNIMDPSFKKIGVAFHEYYWVQMFTG